MSWLAAIAFHGARPHQAIVRPLSGPALLKIPELPGVPTLSLHQLPRAWDKHSFPSQGNNESLVMQNPLGGPRGASWPHLEHSCPQFLSPFSKAVGDGDLAGLRWANSHVEGRDTWRDVDSPPQEVSRFLAALRGLQMHISSQLPGFKASPGWRLLRASHLGPAHSRRKTVIDFLLAEWWLTFSSRKASFWKRGGGCLELFVTTSQP